VTPAERSLAADNGSYAAAERRRAEPEAFGKLAMPATTHQIYRAKTPAEFAVEIEGDTAAARRIKTGEIPPFVMREKQTCDACNGDGTDHDGEPFNGDVCPACKGRKHTIVTRRWLAEAFQIVADDPPSSQRIERGHIVALAVYARATLAAFMPRFPE